MTLLFSSLGILIAFFLAIPSLILEWKRAPHEHHLLLVDLHWWKGRVLTHRESFLLGLFLHLFIGAGFGLLMPLFQYSAQQWFGFGGSFFIWYATAVWFLVLNLVLFPVLKIGWFGAKESAWVWLESLVPLLTMGIGFSLALSWFGVV